MGVGGAIHAPQGGVFRPVESRGVGENLTMGKWGGAISEGVKGCERG